MSRKDFLIAIVAVLLVTSMGMSMHVPSSGTSSSIPRGVTHEMGPSSDPESESMVGTDPTNPDCDGDGLLDGHECKIGTDPSSRDTDGDGLWDGQEVKKNEHDEHFTGTDPLRGETDGDGVGDDEDDEDGDHLPNGEEWRYEESTGRPMRWTRARDPDTDGDGILDGHEVYGNPDNDDQTSDPRLMDTDHDRLTDDVDPRTWIRDILPFSRISGDSGQGRPTFPVTVYKGMPFIVEGWVEINATTYNGGTTGHWIGAVMPMMVRIWIIIDDSMVPISDEVVTGERGIFKVGCTIGDDVKASEVVLAITTHRCGKMVYWPVLWDEVDGNHIPL